MDDPKYVDIHGLSKALWEPESRPHPVTIRNWCRQRKIPYFKLGSGKGGRVYFDVDSVREHLKQHHLISPY